MKKKYRLVAISGAVNASLYPALEKFSILKKFDLIISGDDIKQGKPHPEGLQKAIKKLRVSKDEIIYVGDAPSDVKFAKNAGVRAIVVLTGVLNKKSAKKLRPYLIVKDLNKPKSEIKHFSIKAEEGVIFDPYETHAWRFLEDSVFLLIKSEEYSLTESDTYEGKVV